VAKLLDIIPGPIFRPVQYHRISGRPAFSTYFSFNPAISQLLGIITPSTLFPPFIPPAKRQPYRPSIAPSQIECPSGKRNSTLQLSLLIMSLLLILPLRLLLKSAAIPARTLKWPNNLPQSVCGVTLPLIRESFLLQFF
jgi:hypothetical protein